MTEKRPVCRQGVTLIEVLVSSVVLLVAFLGTIVFRYNAVLGARKADLHAAAANNALLLSEAWRAASDPEVFDPTSLSDARELLIEPAKEGPPVPDGFVPLGTYAIIADDVRYLTALSWGYDPAAVPLRTLNVAIAWQPQTSTSPANDSIGKVFTLNAYTEK